VRRNLGTKRPMINGCQFFGGKGFVRKPASESKKRCWADIRIINTLAYHYLRISHSQMSLSAHDWIMPSLLSS
jgi:hypothetical protein